MYRDSSLNQLKGKKVGIIGLGVSHTDLVYFLIEKGISVTVLDKRDASSIGEDYVKLAEKGADFILGEGYLQKLEQFDVIFRTPGMYYLCEELTQARKKGVVVTSEMEVFFDLCPCKTYALTGSDGKTTTTTLIGEFLKASGKTVHVGGNIGRALLPIIDTITENDVCVVELSSFQLISMKKSPDIAVITNISPNHLDVHGDMEEYTQAKVNVIAHQNAFSRTVLNLDNQATVELSPIVRGELCWFSRKEKVSSGVYLNELGEICSVYKGVENKIMHKDDIKIMGMHNVENFMTAITATLSEVEPAIVKKVAMEFNGVEHRIELVRELEGVRYYNDSIATSPTRTISGLNSFEQKITIIAGGYDKNLSYEPLAPIVCEKVKNLILLGATAPKIEKAVLEDKNFSTSNVNIVMVDTLEEAVAKAKELSTTGDVVSLSPASASFDMYRNFEERGHHYKRIVNALQK